MPKLHRTYPKPKPQDEDDDVDPVVVYLDKYRKIGRPAKLEANPENITLVKRLSEIQCTYAEAASVFGVHRSTFTRWVETDPVINAAWTEGQEQGKMSLRRMQFTKAMAGNIVMLIWLGKNILGQKDHITQDVSMKVEQVDSVSDLKTELEAVRDRMTQKIDERKVVN